MRCILNRSRFALACLVCLSLGLSGTACVRFEREQWTGPASRTDDVADGDPLYTVAFYKTATPEEVSRRIGDRRLGKVKRKSRMGYASNETPVGTTIPMFTWLYLLGAATSMGGTVTYSSISYTPLTEAAAATPYPEVIELLVDAGCAVESANHGALFCALGNPDPAILGALLKRCPDGARREPQIFSRLLYLSAWDTDKKQPPDMTEKIRLLLAAGADPDLPVAIDPESDFEPDTPLMEAIQSGYTEAVRLMAPASKKLGGRDKDGESALSLAILYERWEMVEILLDAGAPLKGDFTAFRNLATGREAREALINRFIDAVGPLSDEVARGIQAAGGADERDICPFLRIALARGAGKDKELLSSALGHADKRGYDKPTAVSLLLRYGADPNYVDEDGTPVLWYAVMNLHMEDVRLLLKAGADANTMDAYSGSAPLAVACRSQLGYRTELIGMLLQTPGIDVETTGRDGFTPLLLVLDSEKATSMLLKAGAQVNAVAPCGWTPLTYAASDEGMTKAIPLLLKAGADPRKADGHGKTALQVAREKGNDRAAALLEAAMAHGQPSR